MKSIVTKTRIAEDTSKRIAELVTALKGWNLISGLYSLDHRSPAEDIVHALAVEAREIILISIRLTCRWGELALREDTAKLTRLELQLANLAEREKNIARQCHKAFLAAANGKEVEA